MPIRFACTHCGQRLKVESRKAGSSSTCPKCKAKITIPEKSVPEEELPLQEAEATAETSEATLSDSDSSPPAAPPALDSNWENPAAEEERPLFNFEPGIELVYESTAPLSPRTSRKRRDEDADLERIGIPRYVIFVQGGLLFVVAVVCFLLGMAVGGAVSERRGPVVEQPLTLSGTVALAAKGNRSADGGSVVIVLPFDAEPEGKSSLVGIRPGDDPAASGKIRDFVQSLGGAVAKCDGRGDFSLQLHKRGRYFLLALSANSPANANAPVNPQHIAQMGKFFKLSEDPLDTLRYQWRIENVRGSQRANVTFD